MAFFKFKITSKYVLKEALNYVNCTQYILNLRRRKLDAAIPQQKHAYYEKDKDLAKIYIFTVLGYEYHFEFYTYFQVNVL